jgi:hypothetical protein
MSNESSPLPPIIICGRKGSFKQFFPDDLYGECAHCGVEIVYRPHAPEGEKICIECYRAIAKKDDKLEITSETEKEITSWLETKLKEGVH